MAGRDTAWQAFSWD